jgi:pSer/pThr/pTyr-binding forkhead associated (FHA) protein
MEDALAGDPRQPVLIMIQGPQPGTVFRLPETRVTTIGRSTRNTIPIVSPSVSRFHCEIASVNGKWQLSDLNSRRGTMVNAEWVTRPVPLCEGDLIRLSSTILRFDRERRGRSMDSALLAIKEAELDAKLRRTDNPTGSIDDIIQRSRFESLADRAAGVETSHVVHIKLPFLALVLVCVAGASVLALTWARKRMPALNGNVPGNVAEAPDAAMSVEEQLAKLRAQASAERERTWGEVNTKLRTARGAEDKTEYHKAFAEYDSLGGLDLDEAARACVEARRELTDKRARAFFARSLLLAEQHTLRGDRKKALQRLSDAAERVGIKALADQAREKFEKLEDEE